MAAPEQVEAGVPVDRPKSPVNQAFRAGLLLSLVAGAVHVFASWLSVAPHGSDWLLKNISWLFVALYFIAVLSGVLYVIFGSIGLVLRIGKVDRLGVGVTAAFCGIVFVIMMLAVGMGETIRNSAFKAITVRGGPLVAAIKQFQAKYGAPPAGLEELVPDFIPAIPDTGIGAYPKYEFITNRNPAKYGGNIWVLSVDVSDNSLVRDALIFYPNQNYPSRQHVASVDRFGD